MHSHVRCVSHQTSRLQFDYQRWTHAPTKHKSIIRNESFRMIHTRNTYCVYDICRVFRQNWIILCKKFYAYHQPWSFIDENRDERLKMNHNKIIVVFHAITKPMSHVPRKPCSVYPFFMLFPVLLPSLLSVVRANGPHRIRTSNIRI